MALYRYIGSDPRYFPTFGRELAAGDTIELDDDPNTPLLIVDANADVAVFDSDDSSAEEA